MTQLNRDYTKFAGGHIALSMVPGVPLDGSSDASPYLADAFASSGGGMETRVVLLEQQFSWTFLGGFEIPAGKTLIVESPSVRMAAVGLLNSRSRLILPNPETAFRAVGFNDGGSDADVRGHTLITNKNWNGITINVTNVSRSSGVSIVTLASPPTVFPGGVVRMTVTTETSFSGDIRVASVSGNQITYLQPGAADVTSAADTGTAVIFDDDIMISGGTFDCNRVGNPSCLWLSGVLFRQTSNSKIKSIRGMGSWDTIASVSARRCTTIRTDSSYSDQIVDCVAVGVPEGNIGIGANDARDYKISRCLSILNYGNGVDLGCSNINTGWGSCISVTSSSNLIGGFNPDNGGDVRFVDCIAENNGTHGLALESGFLAKQARCIVLGGKFRYNTGYGILAGVGTTGIISAPDCRYNSRGIAIDNTVDVTVLNAITKDNGSGGASDCGISVESTSASTPTERINILGLDSGDDGAAVQKYGLLEIESTGGIVRNNYYYLTNLTGNTVAPIAAFAPDGFSTLRGTVLITSTDEGGIYTNSVHRVASDLIVGTSGSTGTQNAVAAVRSQFFGHPFFQLARDNVAKMNLGVNENFGLAHSISLMERTSDVSTLTIGAHGILTDDVINVSGATDASFDGLFRVTGVGATTVSYSQPGDPDVGSSASVGSVSSADSIQLTDGHGNVVLEERAEDGVSRFNYPVVFAGGFGGVTVGSLDLTGDLTAGPGDVSATGASITADSGDTGIPALKLDQQGNERASLVVDSAIESNGMGTVASFSLNSGTRAILQGRYSDQLANFPGPIGVSGWINTGTGYKVSGSQITTADLSDQANIATAGQITSGAAPAVNVTGSGTADLGTGVVT